MAVPAKDWLRITRHEYLRGYVADRGSSIKLVTGPERILSAVDGQLAEFCRERLLPIVSIDAAKTRLHMMQDVFFAVARQVPWDAYAQRWIEAIFRVNGYEWPRPGHAIPIGELAEIFSVDVTLLQRQVLQWITKHLMNERELAHDFRSAMSYLCIRL